MQARAVVIAFQNLYVHWFFESEVCGGHGDKRSTGVPCPWWGWEASATQGEDAIPRYPPQLPEHIDPAEDAASGSISPMNLPAVRTTVRRAETATRRQHP
jgi:hypothetical protein